MPTISPVPARAAKARAVAQARITRDATAAKRRALARLVPHDSEQYSQAVQLAARAQRAYDDARVSALPPDVRDTLDEVSHRAADLYLGAQGLMRGDDGLTDRYYDDVQDALLEQLLGAVIEPERIGEFDRATYEDMAADDDADAALDAARDR